MIRHIYEPLNDLKDEDEGPKVRAKLEGCFAVMHIVYTSVPDKFRKHVHKREYLRALEAVCLNLGRGQLIPGHPGLKDGGCSPGRERSPVRDIQPLGRVIQPDQLHDVNDATDSDLVLLQV